MPGDNLHYYQQMKALAGQKREQYGIQTNKISLTVIRQIYKKEGIKIDVWDIKGSKVKACYFPDGTPSVMVRKSLPTEPKIFSLVHELKHHYVDRESILDGKYQCGDYNVNEVIEVGAEVFAAQFIYPDEEMLRRLNELNIQKGKCSPETIVHFKKNCGAVVSYQFLVKRLTRFGYIAEGECKNVQFKKLEESLYGLPIYKKPGFQENRRRKAAQRAGKSR